MSKDSRHTALLLDTNLLLLAVVGQFDPALVGKRRLDTFSGEDFGLLLRLIAPFDRTLSTPHILAEVSNLADQCVPKTRHRAFREFLAATIAILDERWTAASQIVRSEPFRRLGLTDAAICELAHDQTLVLSVDLELCAVLWGMGLNVRNFNHLRDL